MTDRIDIILRVSNQRGDDMASDASLVHPGSGQNANVPGKSAAVPVYAPNYSETLRGEEPRQQSYIINTANGDECKTANMDNGRIKAGYGSFCKPCLAILLKKAEKLWERKP